MKQERRNFYTLRQTGPFATADHLDFSKTSDHARTFVSSLTPEQKTQYRTMRDEIFSMLDIKSFTEVETLRQDPQRLQKVSDKAYLRIGAMYGIRGPLSEIKTAVERYAEDADNVIDYIKDDIFNGLSVRVEMINEIQATNDPVKLMLISMDEGYHPKPRFEAVRKLELMKLSAAIHQRERESGVSDKFARFIEFMNENVWAKTKRIGDIDEITLVSTHNPTSYGVESVRVTGIDSQASQGEKLTPQSRRTFIVSGHEIPAYVTIRKKENEQKIIKLLRKDDQDPATAVDDELGVMLVFDSNRHLRSFIKHLFESASQAGSQMTVEDISDTLNGGHYNNKNAGGSQGIQMLKFFARMQGARVEFILHTNETYVNQLYKRGVSHSEYEVNRVFDSGVIDLLFPQGFYGIDTKKAQEEVIKRRREKIESH